MSLKVQHLTKIYGTQKAVNDISFSAESNEIVGFLGPNGAGKSTTMKIITGYLAADAGSVWGNGISVTRHPLQAKKITGYLPESNPLYPEMYVREYLAFLADVHRIPNPSRRIQEVIDITGLAPESHKKASQLSKGYKQRLGLAAALIHDPQILILDEPTSGLDPNQIVEIRQLIRDLGKNKTVLFSSHILQEVESVCNRIIIINKGEIVADDTIEHLRATNKSGHQVKVAFDARPNPELLQRLDEVESVLETDGSWYLQTEQPNVVKKKLLELSLAQDWNILSLQTQSRSLEDVFRQLTQKEIEL